jgi:adenine-specific DNA-methyltransferase
MTLTEEAAALVHRTEMRRRAVSARLDARARVKLGQFFTPAPVADFIAALPRLPRSGTVRVLDPGSGIGSLTSSLVARVVSECPGLTLRVTALEIDETLHDDLAATLRDCQAVAARRGVTVVADLCGADFIRWAAEKVTGSLFPGRPEAFDLVVMNPPYRKVNTATVERRLLAEVGVEVTNLYGAFLALAAALLEQHGQLAAITPRSFANGPYFRDFRRFFLERIRLDRLHVVESRSTTFADAEVLQENVIFAATRTGDVHPATVVLSTSSGYEDVPMARVVPYGAVVSPHDRERFIRIVVDEQDTRIATVMDALPATLPQLDLDVATGRVVDFRAREHLRAMPGEQTVPLIYPGHLRRGAVIWPSTGSKKPNALARCGATEKLLLPAETYLLVKRFSTKEERRRVVAAVFDPCEVPGMAVGFENHLNVYHRRNRGMPRDLAQGLCLWLNSTIVDRFVRQFNGHTQINATDLRSLRYPSAAELTALGKALGAGAWPGQSKIDALVAVHVATLGGSPSA